MFDSKKNFEMLTHWIDCNYWIWRVTLSSIGLNRNGNDVSNHQFHLSKDQQRCNSAINKNLNVGQFWSVSTQIQSLIECGHWMHYWGFLTLDSCNFESANYENFQCNWFSQSFRFFVSITSGMAPFILNSKIYW